MLSPGGARIEAPTPSAGPSTIAALFGQLAGIVIALLAALDVAVIPNEDAQLVTGAVVALASLVTMVVSRTRQANHLAALATDRALDGNAARAADADSAADRLERQIGRLVKETERLRAERLHPVQLGGTGYEDSNVEAQDVGWATIDAQDEDGDQGGGLLGAPEDPALEVPAGSVPTTTDQGGDDE